MTLDDYRKFSKKRNKENDHIVAKLNEDNPIHECANTTETSFHYTLSKTLFGHIVSTITMLQTYVLEDGALCNGSIWRPERNYIAKCQQDCGENITTGASLKYI